MSVCTRAWLSLALIDTYDTPHRTEVYEGLNLVNAQIRDENADGMCVASQRAIACAGSPYPCLGYAGVARTLNEAVDLACQLYNDDLGDGCLYFAWHETGRAR